MTLNESLGDEGVWGYRLATASAASTWTSAPPSASPTRPRTPARTTGFADIHRCAVGTRVYWTMWRAPGDPDVPCM